MSLYRTVSNTSGGVQLVDIGNTGFNEVQLDQGAIMKGVSKFVLAVPGGQPASAVNILQQIANSAAAEKQQNQLAKLDRRSLNSRMSLRAKTTKPAMYQEPAEPDPPPAPKPRRRSRKQKLPQQTEPADPVNQASLSASLPELKQEDIVLVPVMVQPPPPREKRKRKSPMRSSMADMFGEPEFTEMYYFEESEGEEDDSYAGNVLHLMKERQRRREMTSQFESLGRLAVPRESKPSRNIVLKKSTKIVKDLTAKGVSLRVQKNLLREINVGLRKRLAELLGMSTHINYESEEEEVEKVGGYNGYKSSSSDPDNDDVDDDDLEWGGSIEDDDEDDDVDDDVKQESDVERQDDFKVELPDDGEGDDLDGGGEGDGEDEDDDSGMTRLKIKQEPESDDETSAVLSTHHDDDDDNDAESQPKFSVRIKEEPGDDDDSAADESASAAAETSTEPTSAIMPSPKSSVHPSNQRSEDDDEVYDRYDRVKVEPRSPVRRALFTDSESQDSAEDRSLDENVLVAATLDMDSLQAVKTELDDDDDGDLLAQDLDDPTGGMGINMDLGLLSNVKPETNDDSNF